MALLEARRLVKWYGRTLRRQRRDLNVNAVRLLACSDLTVPARPPHFV